MFENPSSKTFFWQALLILLPVAVLVTVGFYSLRQDKILAQHEAVERAQVIADELLPKLTATLVSELLKSRAFEVNNGGRLIFPPPVAAVPTPKPLNLAELDSEQQRLWRAAQ